MIHIVFNGTKCRVVSVTCCAPKRLTVTVIALSPLWNLRQYLQQQLDLFRKCRPRHDAVCNTNGQDLRSAAIGTPFSRLFAFFSDVSSCGISSRTAGTAVAVAAG